MSIPLAVLHVEDNEDDHQLALRTLRQSGYAVKAARIETSEEMRAALDAQPWDIILCDHKLPHLDSFGALQVLKESGLDLPFIILSGTISAEVAVEAMQLGAHDFVLKDNQIRLVPAIQRELREAEGRRARKLAEESLLESQQLLAKTFASLREAVFLVEAESTKIKDCNPAASEIFGYSRDELLGQTTEFLHVDQRKLAEFREHLSFAIAKKGFLTLEFEMKRKDGQVFPTEHNVSSVEDAQGRRIAWVSVVRDITERKRAEQDLRESEERYKALYERSLDAVYLHDFEGRFIDANPAALNLLGYTSEEIRSLTFRDLMDPEDQASKALAVVKELQNTGIQRELSEYSLKNKNGASVWVETLSSLVYKDGKPFAIQGIARNITERKRAEQALYASEMFNRKLVEASPAGIINLDRDGRITYENPAMRRMMGVPEGSSSPVIGEKLIDLPSIQPAMSESRIKAILAGKPIKGELIHYRSLAGVEVDLEVHTTPLTDTQGTLEGTLLLALDITERLRAEEARRASEERYRLLINHSPFAILIHQDDKLIFANPSAARLLHAESVDALVGKSIFDLIHPETKEATRERIERMERGETDLLDPTETRFFRLDGVEVPVEVTAASFTLEGRLAVQVIVLDITERIRAEEELKNRLAELDAVNKISTALRAAQSLDEMLPLLLDATMEILQAQRGIIWLYDQVKDELRPTVSRGWEDSPPPPVKPGEQIAGFVFASKVTYLASEYRQDARLSETTRSLIPPGLGGAAVLIRGGNVVIGVLSISVTLPRQMTPGEVHLLTTLCEIAGNAIQRTSLHEQTERRLRRLAALSDIDRAISSNFDLRLSLGALLNQVIDQLVVDAADILLYNPSLHQLKYVTGIGFRTQAFDHTQIRLGEGYAGRAALERRIINIQPLGEQTDNPRFARALQAEPFTSYYGVPLIAKGQIKGVLEIFQRALLEPDAEWLDFLNTLAGQAAIAIDAATLFENLERSNTELTLAYDATIEGWSRALDLRDKETEGHTQRVTEMTVNLALAFDLSKAELLQVRWGVLLHDIGKMGVPDGILLKPGPLTDEEWVVMKRHPNLAYEMLSPIRYLHAALDIPYCHHEKWDGTGYPRGLKGEQIPLTARIFAVIDVWDALTSDRPYRKAWSKEKAIEYIQSGSGTHFDPQVVKKFLLDLEDNDPTRRV